MLERHGDSDGWRRALIGLLERAGWAVTERPAIADGVLLIATGHGTFAQRRWRDACGGRGAAFRTPDGAPPLAGRRVSWEGVSPELRAIIEEVTRAPL